MTSKNTLDLAREWAATVRDGVNVGPNKDRVRAAADVVASLPDEWVDAGNLQRFIDDWERLDPDGEHASLLDGLRRLLPAPPTMAEITWDDAEHAGLVARHKHGQMVRMLAPVHLQITCVTEGGRLHNYRTHNLTPLEGTKIDLAPAARHQATPRQVQAHEVQTQHLYRDRDGDEWEHIDGRWVVGVTHADRVAAGEIGAGTAILPDEYEPYTRIEDTK